MRRRSKAGGKVTKTQFRRTLRRHAKTKVAGRRKPSAVDATERIALLEHRLNETVEQQSATSEVLRVIASSPSEIQSVLDGIAAAAARLLDVADADIMRVEGQLMRCVAKHGPSPQWEIGSTRAINRDWVTGRAVIDRKTVHVRDLQAAESEFPEGAAYAKRYGHRTTLATPLLREGNPIGAFLIRRSYVKPFTNEQIELVQNFAAQAVIAIENARLLNELRESLQQQTATADVLKAISRSTFDLQTVLNTLTESAAGLCEADVAAIIRQRGTANYWATSYGLPPEHSERIKSLPIVPGRGTVVARVLLEGHTVHVPDVLADSEYTFFEAQKIVGFRTALGVPLLREGSPIGVLALMRCSVRPFTDKQIELVETFADQAVIAIENVRLFDEVQTRTRDLTESLQQQTATADVLKVISRSTFDLQTVLGALIETATRLCNADQGAISREIDGAFFRSASYGYSSALSDYIRNTPVQMDRSSIAGRALVEGRIVQIRDVRTDPEYTFSPGLDLGDFRTALGVPMLREGVPIGVLALTRKEVRPFTDKQIELVATFADQAAIAIENVRLFENVEARTRELAKSLNDLRATQDRLVQTQKLASLGQLTAGIAHEIKNPLNFVNNFSGVSSELIDELQQALKGLPIDQKARAEIDELADTLRGNLDKVVQHGKRADAIVKNMLLHSREGSGEHRVVDINALVEESLNLAYHGARAEKQGFNITIERSLDSGAGQVDVFPQDITRVLLNLISNGFYAATKRRAEADGDGYEPTLVASTRSLGDRVEIRVRDNGTGIPPEVKEKMFNPFFTTKPAGEGTGLGLSICHDIIVKQHGGSIEVDTEPGEFTEIKVTLPRAARS
jgi:signal transduction histidine kinase